MEVRRLSGKVAFVVDSERHSEGAEAKAGRAEFKAACNNSDITVCLTVRRSIENYFTDAAVKAVYGNHARALAPYEATNAVGFQWEKSKNWQVAERMSMNDLAGTDIGEFLKQL